MTRFLLLLPIAHLAAAAPEFALQPEPSRLLSPAVSEASGIAVSPSSGNFLWIVNDSGGTPEIHLANTDGTPRGSLLVEGTKNNDWEDLAAFTYQGKPYLLIADTGDNASKRDSVKLYIVREPVLPPEGKSASGKIPVSWEIEFTYQGGPRDCEAVAVDATEGKIILVSKRTEPPAVYELPLHPDPNVRQTAKRIAETRVIAPALSFIPFRNQPTGMDISADGSMAAIVTYHGVFVFTKEKGQSWSEAFAAKPLRPGSHMLHQAESITFSRDGKKIFTVSEGLNSPIAIFE